MRPEKQLLLDEVRDKIKGAPSFLVTRYRGLTAELSHSFRNTIRKSGGDFEVVKKRLLVKAAAAVDVELEVKQLEGHIGLVLTGEDAIGTTKAVVEFGKASTGGLHVLVGRIDGKLYRAKEIERIAELPSLDVVRAQFLGVLAAPMQETLGTMEALLTSIIYCLENRAKGEGIDS